MMKISPANLSTDSILPGSRLLLRWLLLGCLLLAIALAFGLVPGFRKFLMRISSDLMTGNVRGLKELILTFGWWAPAISFLLMILQTLVAPLPAFILAMANAMAFGAIYGFILTITSALTASFVAFYLTRWLGRPFLERRIRPGSMATLDAMLENYGAWGVLILRLFPLVSFDFVSFAAGFTALRASAFGLATLVGMLPATVAYTLLGDATDSANRYSLIGGAALLVLLLTGSVIFRKIQYHKRKTVLAVEREDRAEEYADQSGNKKSDY